MTTPRRPTPVRAGDPSGSSAFRAWAVLVILSAAQFMVVLDFSIVNVALPSIQHAFGLRESQLQWMVSAYALTFGGLLLLGGRAADLFGRRRLFVAGLLGFAAASFIGGVAPNAGLLVAARALQGVAAAVLAPAALSLITTSCLEGPERNRALGIYGALGASGFAIGVFVGGLLTDGPGWRWVFFVNVPVGIAAAILALVYLSESRRAGADRRLDVAGAATATAGLAALIYALAEAPTRGWMAPATWMTLLLAVALLWAFVLIEQRAPAPLMRLDLLRLRNLLVGNFVALSTTAAVGAQVFVISLYLQTVEGYSAAQTGLAFLIQGGAAVFGAAVGARATTRLGLRHALVAGRAASTVGLLLMLPISSRGGSLPLLLAALFLMGLGNVTSLVAASIAATSRVAHGDQGLASGLLATAQQVGSALGVGVLVAVASARTAALAGTSVGQTAALVDGFRFALGGAAAVCAAGAIVALRARPIPARTAAAGSAGDETTVRRAA